MITYNVFIQRLDKLELLYNRVMEDVTLTDKQVDVMSEVEGYISYFRISARPHREASAEMCILGNKHYKSLKSIQKQG